MLHVAPVLGEFLFALFRVVAAQVPDPARSNEEAILTLLGAGLVCGTGQVWDDNACMADSLLQLLIFHGVVPEDAERKSACLANRAHLEARPELVPRDRDGHEVYGGYLQHHRHAEPTLQFFIAWFACSPEVLPAAGFRLVVHARSDDEAHPTDEWLLCVQSGRRAGPCLQCHLFNHTTGGHGGYHYDPLLPVPGAMEVSEDEVVLVEGTAAEEGAPGQPAGMGLESRQRVLHMNNCPCARTRARGKSCSALVAGRPAARPSLLPGCRRQRPQGRCRAAHKPAAATRRPRGHPRASPQPLVAAEAGVARDSEPPRG